MSLKLITNSDAPTSMSFVDIYEKLTKLWELRDLVIERDLSDEFPALERAISHYESLAQYHFNKFENDKLAKTKDLLNYFQTEYTEVSMEAHSLIPDMFGTITMIHPVETSYDIMLVHGLAIEDNYNEKNVSFMLVVDKKDTFISSIEKVVKNFKYLSSLKTYFNEDSQFHVLCAIEQVSEYSPQHKNVVVASQNEISNVIDCSQLFLDRQASVSKNRQMNKLVNDVVNPSAVIPLVAFESSSTSYPMPMTPNEEMVEVLEEMKEVLRPTDDAG